MSSRRKPSRRLAGSHQKSWLWGRHAVVATLDAGRWAPAELWLSESLPSEEIERRRGQAAAFGATVAVAPNDRLTQLCGSREHQGYLARMTAFPYAPLGEVIQTAFSRRGAPMFLALDGIQDAFNFGSMLRSAEVLGIDGVLLGASGQAEVGAHVARSSAGAVNYVPIARVPELAQALRQLKEAGVLVFGASEKAERTIAQSDLTRPLAFLLGNEGVGLSAAAVSLCDELVRIPQLGATNSLNAAVAAGILCYEAMRQRSPRP